MKWNHRNSQTGQCVVMMKELAGILPRFTALPSTESHKCARISSKIDHQEGTHHKKINKYPEISSNLPCFILLCIEVGQLFFSLIDHRHKVEIHYQF
jgi:hypothetical protein